ncbi:TIGR02301 family protein [Henriciella litoralis]|uniref:TIGR02301 family protein n=1 Tax=Henriciella litoralis TaxID=568102 RepID=UPI000A010178|nr:TIGR02301 family protein [Henriciella litoralis]
MNQKIIHLLVLPALACLTLVPALPAYGQYQAEGDYSDTRSQDYLRDVIALSSTLGSAHAIRLTCNGRDDQYWRSYMQELLGIEAPYRSRLRTSMVDAFNSAFSAESSRRSSCDEGAVSAEKVYASTGERLANSLAQANLPSGVRDDEADGTSAEQ